MMPPGPVAQPPVAGLVLAAGSGSRFGRPKALVDYRGRPLVLRAVEVLIAAGCAPVLTVLGAAAAEVRVAVDLPGSVVNADWASGMASSLRCGLAALPASAPAVVITLADQPLVGSAAVVRLVLAWQAGAVAAVATYAGRPRNPVLLIRDVWPDVAAASAGETGARAWLRAHPHLVTEVPCDGTGFPYDIDTPDDLLALEADHAARP